MEGGWKTPPPPSATTRQKSPVLIGLISVIYREAVRWNRINEFLAILAAPVSHFTSKSQVPNEEKTSHKDQGSDKINIAEGTGERSCQVNLVISACSDFSDALSKVKNSSQKYSQAGCGLPSLPI